MSRTELKAKAKEQIKGNIGTLLLCYIITALICGTAIGALLAPALNIGLLTIYLGLTRGEKATFSTLFSKIDLFGRALWLHFLMGLFVFLWSLLLIVPGVIKGFAYMFAPYILADRPELTAREALSESKRITKGHIGNLFVLCLSFILWYLLCIVTFGIASIYVAPYASATFMNYYVSIKDLPPAE